jgi:nitrogen regulatory protein PII-like uncharacterized protein
MNLFGLEFGKKKPEKQNPLSVVPPSTDDGSTVITTASGAANYYGMVLDMDSIVKNENDLIRRYREVAQYSDCDSAIADIVNETIVCEDDKSIEIKLDNLKLSDAIKTKITEEFEEVLRLLDFEEFGPDIFRQWYIDGRVYYQALIDPSNIKNGIAELRKIDPRKIRKIKNVKKQRNDKGIDVVVGVDEYYLYNDKGISEQTTQGIKLTTDSVIYCPSGLIDPNSGMTLGHLHKAVKPTNQLKMIEDAVVIYRISRAPERRIFYVDVGNLPKLKAEQYVNDIMNKFRNKIVYDATTGEVRNDRKHLSMMEDFWMPRREGGKGTEITTLPGGQTLGQIEDIQYFQNKLFQSLNVPLGRLQPTQGFSIGRSTEITREEVKFNKFVSRLRKKFSNLLSDALRIQLISKGIIREDEWSDIKPNIFFDFQKDNYFTELKENEILMSRLATLQQISMYVGTYYSQEWICKNVLQQSDTDIKDIKKQIASEPKPEPEDQGNQQ